MNYKIVEKDAFQVVEKVEIHSIENAENEKSIPNFWTRSHKDGTVSKIIEMAVNKRFIYGICYGISDKYSKDFEYSIAAECSRDCVIPDGFRKRTIPAGTWIIFGCRGAMPGSIQDIWRRIVTEFFPTSVYQPTCELDIEAYNDGDMNSSDYYSEFWVPVKKDNQRR